MCDTFGALPNAGGVLDQDSYLLQGMYFVKLAKDERWKKDHPEPKQSKVATNPFGF